MIPTEQLSQHAVRKFVDTLNARDERAFADAVSPHFSYTSGEEKGDAADFYQACTQFVAVEQSADGNTLTGVMHKSDEPAAARWTFLPRATKDVFRLDIATDVKVSDDAWGHAMYRLHSGAEPRTRQAQFAVWIWRASTSCTAGSGVLSAGSTGSTPERKRPTRTSTRPCTARRPASRATASG
ncbi:hypothetical protein ACWGHD_25050 [Streptomyces xanthophaeus]